MPVGVRESRKDLLALGKGPSVGIKKVAEKS